MEDERMSYVGLKECGCIVAATVDIPERNATNAREIAKWLRDGLKVEHVTVEYVRENLRRCPHKFTQAETQMVMPL